MDHLFDSVIWRVGAVTEQTVVNKLRKRISGNECFAKIPCTETSKERNKDDEMMRKLFETS